MTNPLHDFALLESLSHKLWPLHRSITGPGIEASIELFNQYMDLTIEKVPSGSQVFDWTVPKEWHLKSARLTGPDDEVICDATINNLHVLNYSQPVTAQLSLEDLQPHLFSIPDLPNAIPYVTSYYQDNWGFCLTDEQRQRLKPGTYQAVIEAEFVDGGVPFAHCLIEGDSEQEILLSSYLCHPSMANNELSGPLTLLLLYRRIKQWPKRRYSYRFLLNPETIGTLCFLHNYHHHLKQHLLSGMILTCVGGPEETMRYKQSQPADSLLDKVMFAITNNEIHANETIRSEPFTPVYGSDERQYGAPGFRLPVGQIARTTYGSYAGYHNSLDTLEFMTYESLIKSAETIERILHYTEYCGKPLNLAPFGEPQLGKRGLYPNLNSRVHTGMSADDMADSRLQLNRLLTLLNMADGDTDLFQIANKLNCTIDDLIPIIDTLENHQLIRYGTAR